jgi:general nucleoside transport system ATP-binding protein
MSGIDKAFGEVVALDDAAMEVHRSEVHALLGENGAGKSTLMYILAGLYGADRGTITVRNTDVAIRSPRDSIALGIGMVHQHFELVGPLSALENIALGNVGGWLRLDLDKHRARASELAREHGLAVDLDAPVQELDIGDQQKVEILRVLYAGASILILDEPTTHLTPLEVERLFDSLRSMVAEEGLSVVLIAHKVREVTAVADRVTVLRRGKTVATLGAGEFDAPKIVDLIVGKPLSSYGEQVRHRNVTGETLLKLNQITVRTPPPGVTIHDVSIECRAGEIVGIAGVAGNGQSELMDCLVGLRLPDEGNIRYLDSDINDVPVWGRMKRGLSWLPADRLRDGILHQAPIYESFSLGPHIIWREREKWNRGRLRARARAMVDELRVVAPSEAAQSATLSGGNIQKILVGKALTLMRTHENGVLLAMNPTSGLDIAATEFVHHSLAELVSTGNGILLISEDMDELIALCDTIYVMSTGRIRGRFTWPAFDKREMTAHMLGEATDVRESSP